MIYDVPVAKEGYLLSNLGPIKAKIAIDLRDHYYTLPETARADHDFGVFVADLLQTAGDADFLLYFSFDGLFGSVLFTE